MQQPHRLPNVPYLRTTLNDITMDVIWYGSARQPCVSTATV